MPRNAENITTRIHTVPVLKDNKVIGVCFDCRAGNYICEIWNRSVTVEIDAETKDIVEIVLK